MQKTISMLLGVALAGSIILPVNTFAQTSTPQVQSQLETIKNLLNQIKALQDQINALQKQQQQTISSLLTTLKEGAVGENVKTVQALLAADPAIYPEGLITGFYGKLTAKAVRKFQERHGLEAVGVVGPKTLKKLNEFLEKNPLALEDEDDEKDKRKGKGEGEHRGKGKEKRPCAIVPPGHLIAPGWLRKHGGERPVVPPCQTLPPGIAMKLGLPPATSTATSTPDTIAPVISGLMARSITASSTLIVWTTNEPATSKVYYHTTSPVMLGTASSTIAAGLVLGHDVLLSNLTASTTYFYVAESADASGNTATSSEQSFITPGS